MLFELRSLPYRAFKGAIHVGAHELEELDDYAELGIDNILWIEANPSKYTLIKERIKHFPNMILGEFAAGDGSREYAELNISNWSQASSILDFGTHSTTYPEFKMTDSIKVPVKKIDTWIKDNRLPRDIYNFLNLDIQGYELMALKGLKEQLSYVDFIYTEISTQAVYKDCGLFNEVNDYLNDQGFSLIAKRVYKFAGWGDAFYAKKMKKRLFLKFAFIQSLYRLNKICKRFILIVSDLKEKRS